MSHDYCGGYIPMIVIGESYILNSSSMLQGTSPESTQTMQQLQFVSIMFSHLYLRALTHIILRPELELACL